MIQLRKTKADRSVVYVVVLVTVCTSQIRRRTFEFYEEGVILTRARL